MITEPTEILIPEGTAVQLYDAEPIQITLSDVIDTGSMALQGIDGQENLDCGPWKYEIVEGSTFASF